MSYNFMSRDAGKQKCELNNSTYEGDEEDLETNPIYIYCGTKVNIL